MSEKINANRKKRRKKADQNLAPEIVSVRREGNNLNSYIVQNQYLTEEQLSEAESFVTPKNTLENILVARHYLSESDLLGIQSKFRGIPIIDLFNTTTESSVLELIPKKTAQASVVFPVKKKKNRLVVAMANPLDYGVTTDLRLLTGLQIEPRYAMAADINLMITNKYPSDAILDEWIQSEAAESKRAEATAEKGNEQDNSPIIKLVNSLLTDTIDRKASDIHFDPQEKYMAVRIRIDGELVELNRLPKNIQQAVISRLKVLANLDITESRLPQDGRAFIRNGNKKVDLRVSILPTIYGEKIVIRVLDMSVGVRGLEEFNFDPSVLKSVQYLLHQPHGIFLVTGPTGSGKSSTLYASLNELNQPNINVITVEDPVEFQLEGVNQVQVNSNVGLDFASGLRSILRQDPDVVMVGEIRDGETAEIAIRASMTGHLVLSTLHTNDAISTISRLIDMGIDPFLVANALTGVLSQRLVRTICKGCKIGVAPTEDEREFLARYNLSATKLYTGEGCSQCGNSGFRGRMAIQELLVVSAQMRVLISRSAEAEEFTSLAAKDGMRPLLVDGLDKVIQGYTTIKEVLRVATSE